MEKQCFRCKNILPLKQFSKDRTKKDGYKNLCKACKNKVAKIYDYSKAGKARDAKYARTDKGKLSHRRSSESYRIRHPYKKLVQEFTRAIIALGELIRPEFCEKCKILCKPEAHHEDYKKPLEIIWLCAPCHGKTRRSK